MIYKAYSSNANKLLSLPETGMGYQVIDGQLTGSSQTKRYVVYNADLIVDLDDDFETNKQLIIVRGYTLISNFANPLDIKTDSIKLITKRSLYESKSLSQTKININNRQSGGKGAIDSPKENADGKEFFVRLSAYQNDKRIDFVKNRLKEGSFTTTLHDYLSCIRTKDDPVDRYALPNDETIKWSFYIQPKSNDSLQRGIVQPAFGHEGGGIEAYFENGTSENTYFMTKQYGEIS
jgi:hypothetical protein